MTASNDAATIGRNYASGAYTNLMDFDASQADYRANMAVGRSDRITIRDSLETASESLNKPPEMRHSVDMGMASDETVASIMEGSVRSHALARGKKQVVLRKPYQRNGPGNTKLIKSLQSMPSRD